jgi:hypothetical protein
MNPDASVLRQGVKCDRLFPSVRIAEKRGLVVEIGQAMKIAVSGGGSENVDAP